MRLTFLWLTLLVLFLSGCMADLRTALIKEEGITETNSKKGEKILAESWKKQGFDKIHQFETYTLTAQDTWKGPMGRMANVWPDLKTSLSLTFEIGSFNSRVTFLDGEKKGISAGIHSWNYYEMKEGKTAQEQEGDPRILFALAAYQYFFELADRAMRAPIISWAGKEEIFGKTYDVVFVSWDKPEAHQEHDQYKLLINPQTKMLEYAMYTIRETYLNMPGAQAFFGSIKFSDFKDINGVLIPFTQTIFLNKPKKEKKNIHQFKVSDFQFDAVDAEILKPFPKVKETGDSKLKG